MDFIAAVEMLAGRAGMEVPRSTNVSSEKQQQRKSIYNILDQSSSFYSQQLRHHKEKSRAVDYLKSRGLTGEIARDFGIGFAPPGWDNLYSELAKTNLERQLLIESGMAIEKDKDNTSDDRVYDRFRERVMFPIRDLRGRVIAFGGRIIGDGKPKYLNSPETPVFHKGRELYGLYEARQRNRRLDQLLVVEGYLDVVALAQYGVNYSVATLGTATTDEHLDRLFRMVPTVVFCFDGDSAGSNAAWKALVIALSHMKDGRSARFLFVPDGEDPDSLIRSEGKDKFEWRIDQAMHLPDFFFEKLLGEVDVDTIDGKAHLSKLAMPMIMKIPVGVFRELMIGRLSEMTNLAGDKLLELSGAKPGSSGYQPAIVAVDQPPAEGWDEYSPDEYDGQYDDYYPDQLPQSSDLANKAISLLLRQPELCNIVEESHYTILESAGGCGLLLEIVRVILVEEIRSPVLLLAKYQDRVEFTLLKQLAEQEQLLGIADLPDQYLGVINKLRKKIDEKVSEELKRPLVHKALKDMNEEEKQQLRDLTVRKATNRPMK